MCVYFMYVYIYMYLYINIYIYIFILVVFSLLHIGAYQCTLRYIDTHIHIHIYIQIYIYICIYFCIRMFSVNLGLKLRHVIGNKQHESANQQSCNLNIPEPPLPSSGSSRYGNQLLLGRGILNLHCQNVSSLAKTIVLFGCCDQSPSQSTAPDLSATATWHLSFV